MWLWIIDPTKRFTIAYVGLYSPVTERSAIGIELLGSDWTVVVSHSEVTAITYTVLLFLIGIKVK